jgi:protein-tyrosine phosphatase
MPEILDWRRPAGRRAVVRRAAAALRAGGVVAFPTEAGYQLAAGGLAPDAVAALRPDDPPPLAVRGPADARDWAPGLGPLGLRLARRLWPGPLTLECGAGDGLAGRLPDAVRRAVCPDGRLRLRSPVHEAVRATLRRLGGPLVLAPAPGPADDADQTARAAGDCVAFVVDDGPVPERWPPTVVRVEGGAWRVVRPGAVTDGMLRRQAACRVVFVCTGNTCRSPLAEALCKARLAARIGCPSDELLDRGFHVLSAGLAAAAGGPAADEAVEAARAYGADLAGHRSRPLTADLAAQADHLIAMTRGHLLMLAEACRGLGVRPRLLSPAGADLDDPIGFPREVYEECARQIWDCLGPLVEELAPPSNAAANA